MRQIADHTFREAPTTVIVHARSGVPVGDVRMGPIMTAPKLVGAVSSVLGSILIASGSASAYHGTADHGVAPLGAIIPIVVVIVVGVILLSIWKPQSRKSKAGKRERSPGRRAAHKKQKRAR